MVTHTTGHRNVDCHVTHTAALQFLLRLVALKFVDDDDSGSGGWKGRRTIWRKGFVEKMSFEPGVEERRSDGW